MTNDISELMDEMASKIPKLLGSVVDTLFSVEAGKKMGQSIGSLYKELIEAGIPKEEALQMAKDYMMTIKNISDSFINKNS